LRGLSYGIAVVGAVARLDLFAIRAANLLMAGEQHLDTGGWPHEGIWRSVQEQIHRLPELYSGVLRGEALVKLQRMDGAVTGLLATPVEEKRQYAQALAHLLLASTSFAETCLPNRGHVKHGTKDARKVRRQLIDHFKLDPDPWDAGRK